MLESIGQFIYFTFAWAKDEKRSRRKKSRFRGISRRTTRPRAVEAGRRVFTAVPDDGSRRLYLRHTSTFRFPRFL